MSDFSLLPDQASRIAADIDWLFFSIAGICALVLTLLITVMIVFCVRYRRSSRVRDPEPTPKQRRLIEAVWIVTPLIIFLGFFTGGAILYVDVMAGQPESQALYGEQPFGEEFYGEELYILAKQWMWKIQYPNGFRDINEIHLPVNRPARLLLTSADVIHSFYVPAFRLKHDVLPGRYFALTITPTKTGVYHLFCAEYCGLNHARMRGRVVVLDAEDYADWLRHGQPRADLARRGQMLFHHFGCSGCHSPASRVHAPPLEGIWGRRIYLQSGEWVVADETYVQDSILRPDKQIAAGYRDEMPSFRGVVEPEEIPPLIAYLKSLSTEEAR